MHLLDTVAKSTKHARWIGLFILGNFGQASAGLLNLPDTPLFIEGNKTALVQLVIQRDNNLFFEAYPTYEDLNGDGVLDIRFKPEEIDYYGYFESTFCYTHTGTRFQATSNAVDKKCTTDATSWSGDFLNYATMTRMDVMLRALYGGKRSVDTATETVLRRAFVPWENHTWGIEYTSSDYDGYSITDYTPLAEPLSGRRHHFATNNFVQKNDVPYLRVRENSDERIWNWVDKERTQGDGSADQDIIIDIEVCRPGFLEESCQEYPDGTFKPTGILHDYGENNAMYFSLITGSYENNLQGGVLRTTMSSFGENEVDPSTGVYNAYSGIVHTLDAIQIPNDFVNSTVQTDCDWIYYRTFENGECKAWGNPVAEMMYEGLRYFSGAQTPTPAFYTDGGVDASLGLEAPSWDDPFANSQPYSQCSAAYQLVISDSSPSFDGDQLPGSHFSSFNGSSLSGLTVNGNTQSEFLAGDLAHFISGNESAIPGDKFIGESQGVSDRAPSPKYVDSFRDIRGLAPESPHREGSYYAPSVSYYGHTNDLHVAASDDQTVGNFTLALSNPLPTIDVDVSGRTITFAPFGKTVGNKNADRDVLTRNYGPTNVIVGFVVEEITDTTGSFRVTFEDMEQGADNDMDALLRYEYEVVDDEVIFTVTSLGASGSYKQHLGFTVSGSTDDGVYLVVRDFDTAFDDDPDYFLDVPPGASPGTGWSDSQPLPLVSVLTFSPSTAPTAEVLRSPLWYAAKWGGFNDINDDQLPQTIEWDSNGDGDPDNYFQVSNPSQMEQELSNVFTAISEAKGTASSVGVAGGSLRSDSSIYETNFRAGDWHGNLISRAIDEEGNLTDNIEWNANTRLQTLIDNDERVILTYKPSTGKGIPFRWPDNINSLSSTDLDSEQVNSLSLDPITNRVDQLGASRLDYIRGMPVDGFREREQPLGDIVHSTPQLVGPPTNYYRDNWGDGEPETANPYSEFGNRHLTRDRVVYVGANDGMLHAFAAGEFVDGAWTAGDGSEIFAYVPTPVYEELPELASTDYNHKYYVDASPRAADVIINDEWRSVLVGGLGRGGQGIYALDVTNVSSASENNAEDIVLWEYTDEDDNDVGYTYTSPLIVRMHNGKWMAVFGSGYNSTEPDGNQSSSGKGALFFVDLETGTLTRKLQTFAGTFTNPNGITGVTAIDSDNDDIIDLIYTTDLRGRLMKFDVRSSNAGDWDRIGNQMFGAVDDNDKYVPITTQVAVGTHPTGEGYLVYVGSGKYLEPSDQSDDGELHRIYALWDREPFEEADLLANWLSDRSVFLEQSITSETVTAYDSTGDGINDSSTTVRRSSTEAIDWDTHKGWYMDLGYPVTGHEQIINAPLLRDGKLIFSTHIAIGNECTPDQNGWLMVLDAASGAMPDATIDLDKDGVFSQSEQFSGVNGITNPLSAPRILSGNASDVVLNSSADGSGTTSTSLRAATRTGRLSWRELSP